VELVAEQAKANTGGKPTELFTDSGFRSEANAGYLSDEGIDACIATEKMKHGERPPSPRGPIQSVQGP
jgi:hypothetical protein